jgi:hypothetical protein
MDRFTSEPERPFGGDHLEAFHHGPRILATKLQLVVTALVLDD